MNDQDEALNTVAQPVDSPTTEEAPKTETTGDVEPKPTGAGETEEVANVEGVSKKDANARIRELNAKLKESEAKAQSLAEKMAEFTGSIDPGTQVPYTPTIEPGAEISPEQYKADVVRTAQAVAQLEVQRERALNRINTESQEAVRSNPELDPNSDRFDKDLSETVYEATLAYVKSNPAGSVKDFVDKLMKPYRRSLDREVGQAEEKIAKQVSQAALRPTTVRAEEKRAEDKTIAELESELGLYQ
jgi:hypothetical protein